MNSDASIIAAWIAAGVAIVSVATTSILQIAFRSKDLAAAREQENLRHRRDALHVALKVIDHVFANSEFNNAPPRKPHDWDIALAWEAMNKMIIYCKDPRAAVTAFMRAVGLHNPDTQSVPLYGPTQLEEFRRVVCLELDLPELMYENPDVVWIANLPGAKVDGTA